MVVVVALSLRSPSRSGLHTHTQTFGVAERLLLLLLPQMACVDMDAADAAVSEWCRIGSSPMCCVGVRLAPLLDAARNHKSTSTSLRVPQLPFPQPNLIYNTHTHARRTHTHTHNQCPFMCSSHTSLVLGSAEERTESGRKRKGAHMMRIILNGHETR